MANLSDWAKQLGIVLGVAASVGYAGGYLIVRARAHALGLERPFSLADEAYVFAGFRGLLITLIVELVCLPLVLGAARLAGDAMRAMPPWGSAWGTWVGLALLALASLPLLRILSVDGALLHGSDGLSWAEAAVLGASDRASLALVGLAVLLPTLSAVWLWHRMPLSPTPASMCLLSLLAIQLLCLPICHGALLTDRRVRKLSGVPAAAGNLVEPVAIIDRHSDKVVLWGRNRADQLVLTTLASEALKNPTVVGVTTLGELREHLLAQRGVFAVQDVARTADQPPSAQPGDKPSPVASAAPGGLIERLQSELLLTLEGAGALSENAVEQGQVWLARRGDDGRVVERRRLTKASDLAWPVANSSAAAVYALRGATLVRIEPDTGTVVPVDGAGGVPWRRLAGVLSDGTVVGLAEGSHGDLAPVLWRPGGRPEWAADDGDPAAERKLSQLQNEARTYEGGYTLRAYRVDGGGHGFDVYLERAGWPSPVNVSQCGHDMCGQASLTPDLHQVVYVRQSRYGAALPD